MKFRSMLIAGALCAASAMFAAPAAAQDGYGFGLGLGYSQSYFNGFQGINQKRIPYFALHPPVYYGQKVARPYGFSPFATPPGIVPAEMHYVPKAEFKEITNPFFNPANPSSAPAQAPQAGNGDKSI